jgi:hypothetical protein
LKADSGGALLSLQMVLNNIRKVLQNGSYGGMNDLPQAADGTHAHGLKQLFANLHVAGPKITGGPAAQYAHKLLRAHTARNALTAGFIPKEAHRVQSHIKHATIVGAHYDRA